MMGHAEKDKIGYMLVTTLFEIEHDKPQHLIQSAKIPVLSRNVLQSDKNTDFCYICNLLPCFIAF